MKIAFFSTQFYDSRYFDKFNKGSGHQLTYFKIDLNATTAMLAGGFKAVCAFSNDKIDSNTIQVLAENGVKVIALRSAGFNNVDLVAAADKHICVLRVPSYSPHAIAEHTVALILTLNRKTHKSYNRVREGNFSLENLLGFNLYKKTVGVVGTGKIGAVFCEIMLGFGCHVIASDLVESDYLKQKGVVYQPFDTLLAQADIISLHCPLTTTTHHLFNAVAFAKIKTGAMLINTGRGALINTSAAIKALKKGKLGYLGIDVYEQEENLFFKDLSETIIQDDVIQRLMSFPNVLITPHQGFFTEEALEQIAIITLKNITDFENGKTSENEVRIEKVIK
jgi:D-lactate dehydrogenase